MWATSVIFRNLPKLSIPPLGEFLPNLVTLNSSEVGESESTENSSQEPDKSERRKKTSVTRFLENFLPKKFLEI
jgi:hypothetical protein